MNFYTKDFKLFHQINNAAFSFTSKLNDSLRISLIFLCCVLLESSFYFNTKISNDSNLAMISGTALTALIAVLCVECRSTRVCFNKVFYAPLTLFSAGMILISFVHETDNGFNIFAFDLLLLFPFLYYVLINSNNKKMLYKLLALSSVLEGIVSFLACIISATQGKLGIYDDRLRGMTIHPNILGAVGLLLLISSLYLIEEKEKSKYKDIISAIALGIGIYYMIASACRTALLVSIGCLFALAVFFVKKKDNHKSLSRLILITALLVLVLSIGMSLDSINYRNVARTPNSSEVQTEEQKKTTEPEGEIEKLQKRFDADRNINSFSSGRIGIWKVYCENFSLLGKETGEIEHFFEGIKEWRAHNNLIDYTYRLGYIEGLLYLIFYLLIAGHGLIMLFSKKLNTPEDFFEVMIIGAYAFYALVEIATLPFNRCIPCIFFFSISPLMGRRCADG